MGYFFLAPKKIYFAVVIFVCKHVLGMVEISATQDTTNGSAEYLAFMCRKPRLISISIEVRE